MHDLILAEIIAVPAERSRGRHNPRVVKRKMSKFPTKARAAPDPPPRQVFRYGDHVRIVVPEVDAIKPPAAMPRRRRECQARAARRAFWFEHVRAWRGSGLSRIDYSQRHGLELRSFNQWIARLRHMCHRRRKATPAPA